MKYYLLIAVVIILILIGLLIPTRAVEKRYEDMPRDPILGVQVVHASDLTIPEALGYVKSVYVVLGGNERQLKTSKLASEVSGNDKGFVALLLAENEYMTPDRISKPNKDGTRDHGFCQMNDHWHGDKVYNPQFTDEEWQMKQCYRLYKGGTKFYAKPRSEEYLRKGRIINITL
jgi:hypothetical protein